MSYYYNSKKLDNYNLNCNFINSSFPNLYYDFKNI